MVTIIEILLVLDFNQISFGLKAEVILNGIRYKMWYEELLNPYIQMKIMMKASIQII